MRVRVVGLLDVTQIETHFQLTIYWCVNVTTAALCLSVDNGQMKILNREREKTESKNERLALYCVIFFCVAAFIVEHARAVRSRHMNK